MSELRNMTELKAEFKKLRRSYHTVTCGELREIFRRYGDKQIYLVDSEGNEVPGAFTRIHDFLYSFRWELHPLSEKRISAKNVTISMTRGPGTSTEARHLSKEAFGMWGYIDVPIYVCDTDDGATPQIPAFGEYSICGDRVIFRRSREAYVKYGELLEEWREAKKVESEKRLSQNEMINAGDLKLAQVRRLIPPLFSDMLVGVSPATKPKEA